MDNKKIIFDEIDTSSAAKDFETKISKKYREPLGNTERFRTFFLNGEWGSGKSTFLDKTKQVSKKSFINVKLWEVRDERKELTNKLREKAIEKLKDDKFPKNEKYPS